MSRHEPARIKSRLVSIETSDGHTVALPVDFLDGSKTVQDLLSDFRDIEQEYIPKLSIGRDAVQAYLDYELNNRLKDVSLTIEGLEFFQDDAALNRLWCRSQGASLFELTGDVSSALWQSKLSKLQQVHLADINIAIDYCSEHAYVMVDRVRRRAVMQDNGADPCSITLVDGEPRVEHDRGMELILADDCSSIVDLATDYEQIGSALVESESEPSPIVDGVPTSGLALKSLKLSFRANAWLVPKYHTTKFSIDAAEVTRERDRDVYYLNGEVIDEKVRIWGQYYLFGHRLVRPDNKIVLAGGIHEPDYYDLATGRYILKIQKEFYHVNRKARSRLTVTFDDMTVTLGAAKWFTPLPRRHEQLACVLGGHIVAANEAELIFANYEKTGEYVMALYQEPFVAQLERAVGAHYSKRLAFTSFVVGYRSLICRFYNTDSRDNGVVAILGLETFLASPEAVYQVPVWTSTTALDDKKFWRHALDPAAHPWQPDFWLPLEAHHTDIKVEIEKGD